MILNSVAHTLQDARTTKGWSLTQASRHAGVAERFVRELEDGGSEVPVDIYRREFLRRYARALSLPPDDLWKIFQEEKNMYTHQHSFEFQEHRTPSRFHTPRQWRTFIGTLTLSTVVLYVLFSFTRVWAAPDIVVLFPPDGLTVESAALTMRGSVSTDAIVTINGMTVVPTPSGVFESPITLAKGLNTITVIAQRKRVRSTTVVRQVYFEQ